MDRREVLQIVRDKTWRSHWNERGDTADCQYSIAWSHDDRLLYTGNVRGVISAWDISTGQELWSTRGHPSTVRSISLHPDGRRLASGGNDRVVRIWDAASGQKLLTLRGDGKHGHSVVWSADGRMLASVRESMNVWDASPAFEQEKQPAAR